MRMDVEPIVVYLDVYRIYHEEMKIGEPYRPGTTVCNRCSVVTAMPLPLSGSDESNSEAFLRSIEPAGKVLRTSVDHKSRIC